MAYQTYQVKGGDSLSKIAQQLGLSGWGELYQLNKGVIGSNPNLIRPGQTFNIPGTQAPAPAPAPVQEVQQQVQQPAITEADLAAEYTRGMREQAEKIAAIPTFQQTLPFYKAWESMVPQATSAAASQINPELMRNYKSQYQDYMTGLTSSGGQRFGRGMAGIGDLKASTERSRQGQLQDWLNQYQQGYKSLFYEPSAESWDKARTQGQAPDQNLAKIPTWDEVYGRYQDVYGVGDSPSPLYG
jgi:LysM repeat protein